MFGKMNLSKMFGNMEFGKLSDGRFAMSPKGIAVRDSEGSWITFEPKTCSVTNVADMVFKSGGDSFFKMPVNQVNVGDIILHKEKVLFASEIRPDGRIEAYDFGANETIVVHPIKSIMGNMLFFTKVISLFSLMGIQDGNPENMDMSNIMSNPMMMMLMMGDSGDDIMGGQMGDIMMMNMMSGIFNGNNDGTDINKMLPFLMMSGDSSMDPFEMMMMMNMMGGNGNNNANPFVAMFPEASTAKPAKPAKKSTKRTAKKTATKVDTENSAE